MEQRLSDIAKAVAQSAINAYNNRAVPMYPNESRAIIQAVYDELLIGVRCKINPWKISRNTARAAILCHWRQTRGYFRANWFDALEKDSLFNRAQVAAHAALQKMIRTTNYNRRLDEAYDR